LRGIAAAPALTGAAAVRVEIMDVKVQ